MVATTSTTTPQRLADDLVEFFRHAARDSQQQFFRAAADLDLSLAQLQGLCALGVAERPLALHELSEHMGLSVGAASRAVDALYRDGFVSRREDEADRRVKRVALTAKGDAVLDRLGAARRDALTRFASRLTDAERDGLGRALAPVLTRLGAASE